MVFAKSKTLFRKEDARTVETACTGVRSVPGRFVPDECQRAIAHAGLWQPEAIRP